MWQKLSNADAPKCLFLHVGKGPDFIMFYFELCIAFQSDIKLKSN